LASLFKSLDVVTFKVLMLNHEKVLATVFSLLLT